MNDDELLAARATLNELDTEAASLRSVIHEGIDTAKAINAQVKERQAKLRAVEQRTGPLRQAIKAALNAKAEAARLAAVEAANAAKE